MNIESFQERLYDTVYGITEPPDTIPGVENAFTLGSECYTLYDQMLQAYARLTERLGVEDEDPDVETIITNLMLITRQVSYLMYAYGVKFQIPPDTPGYPLPEYFYPSIDLHNAQSVMQPGYCAAESVIDSDKQKLHRE